YPPVDVAHAVRVHAYRGQDLPPLGALRRIERHPAAIIEPERSVEARYVAAILQPEVFLKGLEQLRVQLVGRLPEHDLEVVEFLAELEIAENAIRIDGLLLAREP